MEILGMNFTVATTVIDGPPPGQQRTQQPANGNETGGGMGIFEGMGMVGMWVLMLAALWFFMFRPQRKRAKEVQAMQEGLRVGENIVTSGGFYGKIVGVGTDAFLVEFGEGRGFKVWVRKSDIAGVKTPVMTPPAKTEAAVGKGE